MEYQIDGDHCWQGRMGTIHMGCTLNLARLAGRGLTSRYGKQVHGADILDDLSFHDELQEADGFISGQPDVALVIRTADCVPVHVTDGVRIALLHAGWRGTRAGIVKRLATLFDMRRVHAVIGPSISSRNYEVDHDLYEDWLTWEPGLARWLEVKTPGSPKRQFNLKGLVRAQLHTMGAATVTTIPLCTYDSPLPSYRRTRQKGTRIYNYIYRSERG